MSKQTAVEWLFQQIYGDTGHIGSYTTDGKDAFEAFEKAKAMEREQHKTSFNKGYDRRNYIHDFEYGGVEYWEEEPKEFEQYYNETYKGGEQ